MRRFRVYVDRDALNRGMAAVHIHDTAREERYTAHEVELFDAIITQHDSPAQDGARVEIQADGIRIAS